ncbi:glutamate receptor ionotropic, kainate 4-like [Panthera uncia]|uniref:glutamate receptor ionotropic, kainate 4-like n=1 Tax=Panthera uncia TaxID=29064 RepID=UPI0020FFAABB|nr:glutamate receptor ionotropic, kainate 4-like [Panthera uncia]
MLDDTRDPTPLLKEIRDDKTATIIIHANASMSHTILLKAAELGMVSAYYTYIFTNLVRHFHSSPPWHRVSIIRVSGV